MNTTRDVGRYAFLLLGLAAAALAATVAIAHDAEATHFRGGTIYAVPHPEVSPTSVRFEGLLFWRIDQPAYFWASPSSCTVGTTFTSMAVSNVIVTAGTSVPMGITVTACNVPGNWFIAKLVQPSTGADGIPFTYSAALDPATGAPWVAYWEGASRLDAGSPNHHVNNPDRGWRLETTVNLAGPAPDNPPKPFVPPIVQCPTAGPCVIAVPVADSDIGEATSMVFATPSEADCQFLAFAPYCPGSTFYQPGDPGCPVATCGTAALATLDLSAGNMLWDTTGAYVAPSPDRTYYSAQIMVTDATEKVPMDFFIRLVDGIPPYWVMPPSPCSQDKTVVQGKTLAFDVQAASTDASKTVTILPVNYPTGSSFAGGAAGNPSSGTFTWPTPGVPIGQYLAVFFAEDNDGLTAPTCVVRIHVVPPPIPDFTWHFESNNALVGPTYDPVHFQDTSVMSPFLAGEPASRLWDFGDPNDLSAGSGLNPIHVQYIDDGVYTVCMDLTVGTFDPWTGSVCHDVTVENRPPTPVIHPVTLQGNSLKFSDIGGDLDGTVVNYAWDFGDGTLVSSANGKFENHMYLKGGVFHVCLVTTDDDGATGSTCIDVLVRMPEQRPDADQDGIEDVADNCPTTPNHDQADADNDGVGDVCADATAGPQETGPAATAAAPSGPDSDRDGYADVADDCPTVPDRSQADADRDGVGDACDADVDGDGILNAAPDRARLDDCPTVPNADQADADQDGLGDACDDGVAGPGVGERIGEAAGSLGDGGAEPAPETGAAGLLSTSAGRWSAVAGLAILVAAGAGLAFWAVRRWK